MTGTCLCHPYFLILPFREQKHVLASYFLSFLPAFLVKMPFHPFKLIFGSPNRDFRNQSGRKPMAKDFHRYCKSLKHRRNRTCLGDRHIALHLYTTKSRGKGVRNRAAEAVSGHDYRIPVTVRATRMPYSERAMSVWYVW